VRPCRIEPEALDAVEQWVAQRRTRWAQRFDRLGKLLAEDE